MHKMLVGGHKAYLIVGLYDDGSPGEIFVTMGKDGSTVGGLMKCISILTSVCLQNGISMEYLRGRFEGMRFEPRGTTTNSDIPTAESIVDYIFRWIELEVNKRKQAQGAEL